MSEETVKPDHYKLFDNYEVMDVLEAILTPEEFRGFHRGNAIKYLLRANKKGNEQKDLKKCKFYIDMLLGDNDGHI